MANFITLLNDTFTYGAQTDSSGSLGTPGTLGPYYATYQSGGLISVNGSNQLQWGTNGAFGSGILGPIVTPINYANVIFGNTLNQEIWVLTPDITPLFNGSNHYFGAVFRMTDSDPGFGGYPGTFYTSYMMSGANMYYWTEGRWQNNLTLNAQNGYGGGVAHNMAEGRACALHYVCYWDQFARQNVIVTEVFDVSSLQSGTAVTPFGNGTQTVVLTAQKDHTPPPGYNYPRQFANFGAGFYPPYGALTMTGGGIGVQGGMGLLCCCNNTVTTPFVVNQVIWGDPGVGPDPTSLVARAPINEGPRKLWAFGGPYVGFMKGNTNVQATWEVGTSATNPICYEYLYNPATDQDVFEVGFMGFSTMNTGEGDAILPNSYQVMGSVFPAIWTNTATDQYVKLPTAAVQQTPQLPGPTYGRAVPLQSDTGAFNITVLPSSAGAGNVLRCKLPDRMRPGLPVKFRLQIQVPAGGELPTGTPSFDLAVNNETQYWNAPIATVSAPTYGQQCSIQAYYNSFVTGITGGPYYVVSTFINEQSGETTASSQSVVNMSISSTLTSNAGVDTTGSLMITDSTLSLVTNMYVGARLTISSNNYYVTANTATTISCRRTANSSSVASSNKTWIGSTPTSTTAYTLLANVLLFQCDNAQIAGGNLATNPLDGIQKIKWYVGTTNSGPYYLLTDPAGIPIERTLTVQSALPTSGTQPPGSNTCLLDMTRAVQQSVLSWSVTTASGQCFYPAWIGGGTGTTTPVSICAFGTSITVGQDDALRGWLERAWKVYTGGTGYPVLNLAKSGAPLVEDLSDYTGRQWMGRMIQARHCTHLIIDHFTNDGCALPIFENYMTLCANIAHEAGLVVIATTPLPRPAIALTGQLADYGTSLANQVLPTTQGPLPNTTTRWGLYNAWVKANSGPGQIFDWYIDLYAACADPTTAKWIPILAGTTYYRPDTYAAAVWPSITGTVTSSTANSMTDTTANFVADPLALTSISGSGYAVVKSLTSGGQATYLLINVVNSATQVTGNNNWTNGQPAGSAAYTINATLTGEGTHPSPLGAAQIVALAARPAFLANQLPGSVYTVKDIPIRASF